MIKTAVIMAGGVGERFWPKSRRNFPKQFLSLTEDNQTLLQKAVLRVAKIVDTANIIIVTNRKYYDLVCKQLPDVNPRNILLEPEGKNTAPCIGLAAAHIQKYYGDAVMYVLPSDHLIKNENIFCDILTQATAVAERGENLVTIGVYPLYPETGYGYIHFDYKCDEFSGTVYKVKRFVEKPDILRAKEYIKCGNYLWNSGIFVWKASTILNKLQLYHPDTYSGLMKIKESMDTSEYEETLRVEYGMLQADSIDYAVMEKSDTIFTIPGSFGWDDVGSWLSLERTHDSDDNNNIISGNVVQIESTNSIVEAQEKLVVMIGVEDLVVVDTDDAILICTKQHAQNVKKALEKLKNENKTQYL